MKQPPAWYDSNADNPPWIKTLAGWAYVRGLVFGCPTALPHGERLLQRQELRRLIWRLTNEPTIAYYLVRRLRFIPWPGAWEWLHFGDRSRGPICRRENFSMSFW